MPELILYPLTKRHPEQVIVKKKDKLEHNYRILRKFHIDEEEKMMKFMDKHALFNPETFYYSYIE
jgi:hypothetical protein